MRASARSQRACARRCVPIADAGPQPVRRRAKGRAPRVAAHARPARHEQPPAPARPAAPRAVHRRAKAARDRETAEGRALNQRRFSNTKCSRIDADLASIVWGASPPRRAQLVEPPRGRTPGRRGLWPLVVESSTVISISLDFHASRSRNKTSIAIPESKCLAVRFSTSAFTRLRADNPHPATSKSKVYSPVSTRIPLCVGTDELLTG